MINEKKGFRLDHGIGFKRPKHSHCPKSKDELKELLEKLIAERGNEGDFNDIDTCKITDMSKLFYGKKGFNGDISQWDVSNVTNKDGMFDDCPIKDEFKPKFKIQ